MRETMKSIFKIAICLALFASTQSVQAQEVNMDLVVVPEDDRPRTFEDYLVQLAWKNTPANRINEQDKSVAELEVNKAKWGWVKGFNGGVNINPGNQTITINENLYVLPGINYGISLNPSALIESGMDKKIAEAKVKVYEFKTDQAKLALRAETLTRYQNYKMAVDILKSRDQNETSAESALTIITRSFKDGKVPYTDYSKATTDFNAAKEGRIEAETNVALAVIALEEMIGIDWEVASRNKNAYK